MKKIPNITGEDLYYYLKSFHLDKEELFSYNRLTEKGAKRLYDCLYHLTGAKINGKSIEIELPEERKIKTGDFEEKPFDHTQIDSMEKMVKAINEVISFRNFAVEQIESTLSKNESVFDSLSEEEQKRHQGAMKKAQSHIDDLNEIGKHRELQIMDLPSEVVDDLLQARNLSLEMRDKAEAREKELQELENEKPNNEMER